MNFINDMETLIAYRKKIIYQCSYRGFKEGDLLLSAFAKQKVDKMKRKELKILETFLNLPEQEILNHIYHPQTSPELFRDLCQHIHTFALNHL